MHNEIDFEALHGFIAESNDSLQAIESDFIELESDPGSTDIINNIFRPVHSLKGNSGFFGLTNINKFAHRLENLLDYLRKGELLVTHEMIDILLTGIDHLKEMLKRASLDPSDVIIRPEEEDFLLLVEKHRPEEATGSIQSVIEFEKILQEAMDEEIVIEDVPMIKNILSQIEKSIKESREFIDEFKANKNRNSYSKENNYSLEQIDYSDQVRILISAGEILSAKSIHDKTSLTKLRATLNELSALTTEKAEIAAPLEELSALANFLDDELMCANGDYIASFHVAVGRIISSFTVSKNTGPDEERLGEILIRNNMVDADTIKEVLAKQKKLGELLLEAKAVKEDDLKKALQIQGQKALEKHINHPVAKDIVKTIRIDQDKLDSFADSVGDLFISIDTIGFLKRQMEARKVDINLISKFDNTIRTIDKVVEKLHDKVMSIRRVQLRNLFQRFPRVIRQLAGSLEKDVHFIIRGEQTVIDKDLLEKIENPLVHLLRNSVDHGIEKPEDRKAKNKPEQGTLQLSASNDENNIYLTITDDGAGIDPEKIKQIALEKEFMTEREIESLNKNELINLIFRPGFSSAKEITDISGRGVGLDVVLSALKECNGHVDVDSTVDQGTTITIKIPLSRTLVTRDAMIIKSNGQTFVLPSDDITTVLETDNIIPVISEGCIAYDNSILRIVDINSFFNPSKYLPPDKNSMKAFALSKTHQIAIMVDQVVNHQKVVVKEFEDGYSKLHNIDGIKGYTIMGDDEVTLIIDIEKLAEQSRDHSPPKFC